MVRDHVQEYPSEWDAITSVGEKLGVGTEALRKWIRRSEIDDGSRPGLATDEREQLKRLERENRELRRANEILNLPRLSPGPSSTADS